MCLLIPTVNEFPQNSYFTILRFMKKILNVELMFDASKRHKDSEISRGEKRRGCRPILMANVVIE